MRREATSPQEIEQVQRVGALLGERNSYTGRMITVTTANGQRLAGKLVSHISGSRLIKGGKATSHYGSIGLATAAGVAKINFLDIVWISKP